MKNCQILRRAASAKLIYFSSSCFLLHRISFVIDRASLFALHAVRINRFTLLCLRNYGSLVRFDRRREANWLPENAKRLTAAVLAISVDLEPVQKINANQFVDE
jgi:hypothetical protein